MGLSWLGWYAFRIDSAHMTPEQERFEQTLSGVLAIRRVKVLEAALLQVKAHAVYSLNQKGQRTSPALFAPSAGKWLLEIIEPALDALLAREASVPSDWHAQAKALPVYLEADIQRRPSTDEYFLAADVLALVPPVPEASGWRPISEAPKDGTEILLTDGCYKRTGYWATRIAAWSVDTVVALPMPTRWLPLPAAT